MFGEINCSTKTKKMKKIGTYVGVCDFRDKSEVEEMSSWFVQKNRFSDLKLIVGLMTNFRILKGWPDKFSGTYPYPENFKEIFSVKGDHLIRCIHYVDLKNNQGLGENLCRLVDLCEGNLDAIQLNIAWPDPNEIEKFRKKSKTPLILQINTDAMTECKNKAWSVADRLHMKYGGLLSSVIIDCLFSVEANFDPFVMEKYIDAINSRDSNMKIAVAGRLGPETVGVARDLIKKHHVSTDAQTRLKMDGNFINPVHLPFARQYVQNVLNFH